MSCDCWAWDLAKSESIQLDQLQKCPSIIVQNLMLPLSYPPPYSCGSSSQFNPTGIAFCNCHLGAPQKPRVWHPEGVLENSTGESQLLCLCLYESQNQLMSGSKCLWGREWAVNMYWPLSNPSVTFVVAKAETGIFLQREETCRKHSYNCMEKKPMAAWNSKKQGNKDKNKNK